MRGGLTALAGLMVLIAAPALAAPCKTSGTIGAPIAFPKNDPSDIAYARSMTTVMFTEILGAPPRTLDCTRMVVHTALGDYLLGGENNQIYARIAIRADGKAGPILYLAASPERPGTFALVVAQGSLTVVKLFYAGIPTDARLAEDMRAALAGDRWIMMFDAEAKTVRYGFTPAGGVPPAVQSGSQSESADESVSITAGPQVMVTGADDMRWLEGMRHKPSGFTCPETFDGLAVLLKHVDGGADSLTCDYRAGTDLTYRESDPIRYRITLRRLSLGENARAAFDRLIADNRGDLHIMGDHAPPLAPGPSPAPQFVAYWDTEAGVQGLSVGSAGRWTVWVWAKYAPGAANDAEAGKVAGILFDAVAKQLR